MNIKTSQAVALILTTLSFLTVIFIPNESSSMLDKFTVAATVAGLVGLFSQFVVDLLDKIFDNETRVCFIAKNSEFSIAILRGCLRRASLEIDSLLDINLLEKMTEEEVEEVVRKKINKFDTFIIRFDDVSFALHIVNKIYRRGKKVILVDKNLDLKDINQLKSSKIPAFISSDFKLGGESLGQWLNDYFSAESDYKILILKGPRSVETSRNRVSALELSISQEKFDVDGLILDNFTPNDSAELDALLSRSDLSEYDALFCGNDNVAEYLMKKARLGQIKVKDGVVFMGYDGSLKKNLYDYNFVTIDVNPEKQGDLAFSLCKERRKDIQGWKEYITPKRLEYLVE